MESFFLLLVFFGFPVKHIPSSNLDRNYKAECASQSTENEFIETDIYAPHLMLELCHRTRTNLLIRGNTYHRFLLYILSLLCYILAINWQNSYDSGSARVNLEPRSLEILADCVFNFLHSKSDISIR